MGAKKYDSYSHRKDHNKQPFGSIGHSKWYIRKTLWRCDIDIKFEERQNFENTQYLNWPFNIASSHHCKYLKVIDSYLEYSQIYFFQMKHVTDCREYQDTSKECTNYENDLFWTLLALAIETSVAVLFDFRFVSPIEVINVEPISGPASHACFKTVRVVFV